MSETIQTKFAIAMRELKDFLPLETDLLSVSQVHGPLRSWWAVTIETGPETHPMCQAYHALVDCESKAQAEEVLALVTKEIGAVPRGKGYFGRARH